MNITALKSDAKMIVREPILILFLTLPLFIIIIFKLIVVFGATLITKFTGVSISNYYGYILTGAFLMTPSMLGTVAGFLMIDERDARISELISTTPIGYLGYILNRLLIPFVGGIFYTFSAYFILKIYYIHPFILIYLALLSGVQGLLIGYILYFLADDKVKGLTYAKGMSVFTVLAMADLINKPWIIVIAGMTPFYWITKIVIEANKVFPITIALAIHIIYIAFLIRAIKK